MENNKYVNLVEATNGLQKRGFDSDFDVAMNCCLMDRKSDKIYQPEEVKIVEYHRLEAMTNPQDDAIIYALETKDGKKGMLIDAYGSNASARISDFLKKIEEINS